MTPAHCIALCAVAFFVGGLVGCVGARHFWRGLLARLVRSLEPCASCDHRTPDRTQYGTPACWCVQGDEQARGVSDALSEAQSVLARGGAE